MNPNMKTDSYRGRTIDAMTVTVGNLSQWNAFVSGAIVNHRSLDSADDALSYARDWIDRTQRDPDVPELRAKVEELEGTIARYQEAEALLRDLATSIFDMQQLMELAADVLAPTTVEPTFPEALAYVNSTHETLDLMAKRIKAATAGK